MNQIIIAILFVLEYAVLYVISYFWIKRIITGAFPDAGCGDFDCNFQRKISLLLFIGPIMFRTALRADDYISNPLEERDSSYLMLRDSEDCCSKKKRK